MNICALVPSYNPDERLVSTAKGLRDAGFRHVIVVDDGSRPECRPYFDSLLAMGCTVIRLPKNRGKGEALRVGFLTFLTRGWADAGIVTVDGDGQHSAEDALRCAGELLRHPHTLILGGRDLSGSGVPAKSKRGSRIMTFLLNRLCGIPIRDTQTGLRAIPASCLAAFSGLAGSRYEYETNMLLYCRRHHIPMTELPISTIYIDNNAGSHYRPAADSLRIGVILCRWLLLSAAGPLAGLAAFAYCILLGGVLALPEWAVIWLGTAMSGLIAGMAGFSTHRTDPSQPGIDARREAASYGIISALQSAASGLLLSFCAALLPWVPFLAAKVAAEILLGPFFSRIQNQVTFRQAISLMGRTPV